MIHLRETTDVQKIKFIPKELKATSIVLNDVVIDDLEFYIENYYLIVSSVFDLKEGNFYDLIVKKGTDIVYIDKVFCTNQELKDYTINENTYIVYE
jgi:hypothetical protein